MKITIRLIVSLVLVVALVALVFSLFQVSSERRRLTGELERRSLVLADSLQESISPLIKSNAVSRLNRIVNRFGNRERLNGVAVFDKQGSLLTSTSTLKLGFTKPLAQAIDSVVENRSIGSFMTIDGQRMYICIIPIIGEDNNITGALATFNDISYIDVRLREIWKQNVIRFLILSILVVFCTILVVKWSITGPIARLAAWVRP